MDIPFALVVTKMDLVDPLFSRESNSNREEQLNQAIGCEKDELNREEAAKNWLRSIGEDALLSSIANNFSVSRIFLVSSLGSAPTMTPAFSYQSVKPYRALNPLWWLLKKNGVVD